jgi:hypothetical protein
MQTTGAAGAGEIRQSMTLRSLRVDTPVPDSVFEFTPPEGAREVAEFGKSRSPRAELAGKPAPALRVEALGGRAFGSLAGRSSCSISGRRGVRLAEKRCQSWRTWTGNSPSGLVVLDLAVNDDRAAVARLTQENAISYPVAMVDLMVAGEFGVGCYVVSIEMASSSPILLTRQT